jgi:hypothetical protein
MKIKSILLAVALCAGLFTASAQVPVNTNTIIAPDLKSSAITFVQGASDAKVISFAVYPSYAPGIVKDKWGIGVAALYPIAPVTLDNHAFTGLRLDYIGGKFFAATASVGAKADVQLFGHTFTPFVVTGAIIPIQGAGNANAEVGFIAGGGVTTTIWKSADGKKAVSLFGEVEHVTLFDGQIYHGGAAFTLHF